MIRQEQNYTFLPNTGWKLLSNNFWMILKRKYILHVVDCSLRHVNFVHFPLVSLEELNVCCKLLDF